MKEVDIRPMTDRVVVDHHGRAERPDKAFHDEGIIARVIFIRGDGWALGAPPELEGVAYRQWQEQWREYRRFPDYEIRPINEYTGPPRKSRR